jgi:LPXTG-motif cell wall-anchored protein
MTSLPSTAGPLPLLALSGMLTLGFGGLLTLYRRRR